MYQDSCKFREHERLDHEIPKKQQKQCDGRPVGDHSDGVSGDVLPDPAAVENDLVDPVPRHQPAMRRLDRAGEEQASMDRRSLVVFDRLAIDDTPVSLEGLSDIMPPVK